MPGDLVSRESGAEAPKNLRDSWNTLLRCSNCPEHSLKLRLITIPGAVLLLASLQHRGVLLQFRPYKLWGWELWQMQKTSGKRANLVELSGPQTPAIA
ncbi:MAG TPA: hypothetical protein VGO47_11820 [Chlamydiales bacterium]|nr:hypothetical protein [Chlamydiales bacterium]